jgi:predicted nucleotide-binding protein (sugar kinase/HSP70/actin superfamily)
MKNGMVTFSVMNNVCAAGTGSFIEEQAHKLGCPLTKYAERAMNVAAPYASDRCTVFMERDINYYLIDGYSVEEVLASVLHSVRENYLTKVAVQGAIGKEICFQGATAKNKALVAAFEQKLQKPIFVSQYCHVTGALGSALMVLENEVTHSRFRGISLYREKIPIETEICDLCRNNCKITKIRIRDDIVAFGFLCGRDYDTKKYKKEKKNSFNLTRAYRKAFSLPGNPPGYKTDMTIGIPYGLYLSEEENLWKHFFSSLGVRTISSKGMEQSIKTGKKMTTTEFCAPLTAFLGHVEYCAHHANFIFLPVYLETREKENPKKYCYYSQYASVIATSIEKLHIEERVIMPVIDSKHFMITMELTKLLRPLIKCTYWSVYFAYHQALAFHKESKEKLKNIFKREFEPTKELSILFIGRPYIVLNNSMNKLIPDIFRNLNIKTFFQDMIESTAAIKDEIEGLLTAFHWNYASKILESALFAAKTEGLYPVYMTSFKCGPDSFALEYFKRIMDTYGKPYLILQLDEHDSSVGYETRIEAAVRSFKNHFSTMKTDKAPRHTALPINPRLIKKIGEKTLLLPCWDHLSIKLIEAVLIRSGIDARMVPLTSQAIQRGPATNTGMCIPVNIIIQSIIDYVESQCMDPEQVAVWNFKSTLACNITLYPYFLKSAFEAYGSNMEKISVYCGDFTFKEISYKTTLEAYFAHYFGGMLRRIGCRIRPYEKKRGITDKTIHQSLSIFYNSILGNQKKEKAIKKVIHLFKKIKTVPSTRPKVAIFGDLYVRDNDIMNQDLLHYIEDQGGEVIILPFNEMVKMMAAPHIERSIKSGIYIDAITAKAMISFINTIEKNYNKYFMEILEEKPMKWDADIKELLNFFHLDINHNGESVDNILISRALKQHYPDIRLFVHAIPAFCSAGLVTEALESKIEKLTGVPVVTLIYDGTHKNQNEKIIPYMKFS